MKVGQKLFVGRVALPRCVEIALDAEVEIISAYKAAWDIHDSEVSGLARVHQEDEGRYVISDPVIPRQTCSGGETLLFGNDLGQVYAQIMQEGGDPDEYYCWWHSHPWSPKPWFSSIDEMMIRRRLSLMLTQVHLDLDDPLPEETMAGPLISLVGNVEGEITMRCDFVYRLGEERHLIRDVTPLTRSADRKAQAEGISDRERAMRRIVRERIERRYKKDERSMGNHRSNLFSSGADTFEAL